jgi:hypothetical protein
LIAGIPLARPQQIIINGEIAFRGIVPTEIPIHGVALNLAPRSLVPEPRAGSLHTCCQLLSGRIGERVTRRTLFVRPGAADVYYRIRQSTD